MSRIIFFDGICSLCNRFVRLVYKFDKGKSFKFASLQSQTAVKLLPETDRNADSVVYIDQDMKVYRKSGAILRIMFQIGGAWTLAALVFSALPVRLRDFIYDVVARNRYRIFGKLETCPLPTAQEKAYFLE